MNSKQVRYGTSYTQAKQELEKSWLEQTIKDCKYNQSKTAKVLGMSRGTLRTRLKEYFGNKYFRDSE